MGSTRKKMRKAKARKLRMKGGFGESLGLPECNNLSQFPITDDQILTFSRIKGSPADCFISALQILNLIDAKTANIMRISKAGTIGFSIDEIEKIMISLYGYNFKCSVATDTASFTNAIDTILKKGHAVIAGHMKPLGHIYLIGRTMEGVLMLIDPQLNALCDLSNPECNSYILSKELHVLLFNSQEELTLKQMEAIGLDS
jgi:hypothetical protein